MNELSGGDKYTGTIAVLIPCYNEELTVASVIDGFRSALPDAKIFICDNNSTDRTAEIASESGAFVLHETRRGKGNAVRRMFSDIDADIYVLVDGDNTYDAPSAPKLINALLTGHLDMVNGSRVVESDLAYRFGHQFGNRMLSNLVATIFGDLFTDMLSGYRVFSRRFVKTFPSLSSGFEIETELTVHALELRMPVAEIPTPYRERPEESESKLNTYRDGFRILKLIGDLVKKEKPLQFFSIIALIFAVLSIILGWPIVTNYLQTGLVPRFPTAMLASALMILAFLSVSSGLILDTVTHGRREIKRIAYLSIPSSGQDSCER